MAHSLSTPTTPPDPPSYEALAVNLRQPLRRDNIRLLLNFRSPPAGLFGLSHLVKQDTLLSRIALARIIIVKSNQFFSSNYVSIYIMKVSSKIIHKTNMRCMLLFCFVRTKVRIFLILNISARVLSNTYEY